MTTTESDLRATITAGRRALAALALPGAAQLDVVLTFLDGPVVIAVVGLPGSGRSTVRAALEGAGIPAETVELDVRDPGSRLWDMLVLVTPADQALSRLEADLVAQVRRQGGLAAVAVTHVDLFGSDAARAAAQEELEQHRLEPALRPLSVQWHFVGEDSSRRQLAHQVAQALSADPTTLHENTATWSAARVVTESARSLGDRLDAREREFAQLREIEAVLPLTVAHLDEEVNHARLAVRDTCRTAELRVIEACEPVAAGAAAWVRRRGLGPWSDVELPLRQAWEAYVRTVSGLLDLQAGRLATEIDRQRARIAAVGLEIDLPVPAQQQQQPGSWSDDEVAAALRAVSAIDLSPIFTHLSKRCRELAAEQDTDDDSQPAHTRDRQTITQRAMEGIKQFGRTTVLEQLRILLTGDLETLLRVRADLFLTAASAASVTGARGEVEAAATAMRSTVAELREGLTQRHAWGESYRELLDARDRLGGRG